MVGTLGISGERFEPSRPARGAAPARGPGRPTAPGGYIDGTGDGRRSAPGRRRVPDVRDQQPAIALKSSRPTGGRAAAARRAVGQLAGLALACQQFARGRLAGRLFVGRQAAYCEHRDHTDRRQVPSACRRASGVSDGLIASESRYRTGHHWPSAGDFATASLRLPPAPALFSDEHRLPEALPHSSAIRRATMSALPPASA